PHGDSAARARLEARDRHRTGLGAGMPGSLLKAELHRVVGDLRDRHRRLRSRGSDRVGDRSEPAVRDPVAVGYRDHGARRAARPVPPAQGLPAAGGTGGGADRHDRGLLPVRDHSRAPRPGGGRGGLRPWLLDPGGRTQALHRHRHPRRDGDAHNLYLHSSVVQTRRYEETPAGKRVAVRYAFLDSTIALTCALFINAAILVVAAATFHTSGHTEVAEIQDAYQLLTPLLGVAGASAVFALALLASGQNSTLTGTLAGQIVMEGFLNIRIRPWLRRLITRLIAIVPAAL